ncbi:MAG: PspC domain-containing protein [Gammaproteobacteria bacterium]|nr:PspC domain-containing protein [Gammaproteobacteria bacterium]MBU2678493.1 PspC domain-containing protein [Gammaproteobacteria bacterium]NNC56907.1 PspC domain-containing protein [Woeseiaceae bacterium]NNL52228.1 PspC domain-containing protein [Woeseiaceae bacterium]
MSSYSETSRQRLYRDADRAVLGGVCAGLAGYFGLNLKVTRFLAVVAFLMAMPMAVAAYLTAVFLIPAESGRGYDTVVETRCCWKSRRTRRSKRSARRRDRRVSEEPIEMPAGPSIKDVRKRYQSLDKRLADLEKQVTSPRFQLEQEFRRL